MQKIVLTLLLVVIFVFTCSYIAKVRSGNYSQESTTPNIALLIGINKYPNLPERFQLKGCVNDVEMMKQLLIEKFQFDLQNIHVLTDEKATRQNIINKFEDFLIQNASEDGQVVFFHSGHGARMTDLNGDESDGYDETIVTFDSRDWEKKIKDITDDELRTLLGKLTKKCKNVTIILDCCHSGSGIRGEFAIPKQIPALKLDQPVIKTEQIIKDGPAGFLPSDPNYVLISACKDNEFAYEYEGHGVLTSTFNRIVRKYPKATYREIMYKVGEKVTFVFHTQHPQLEGKRRDAKIFGNMGIVENFVEVIKVKKEKVKLNAGAAHNVTKGSIYALYKPGTTTRKDKGNYLGRAKIVKVEPFFSWAKIEEEKGEIVKNAAAFEIAHYYGDLQLAVRLDLKENADIEVKIKNVLKGHTNKEDLVKIVSQKERFGVNIRLENNTLLLERPDLTQLKKMAANDNNIKYKLIEMLTKEARRLNIFNLENEKSGLKVEFILEAWEDVDDNLNPINKLENKETEGGQKYMNIGDIIQVTIKNKSNKPIYPYLLDLGSDGCIKVLFPAPGAQDSPLDSNETIIRSGLMRISPPEGLNGLKLIATTVPTDFSVLTQMGYRGIKNTITAKRGLDSPLGKLLNMAWGGKRNNEQIKPKEIDDWTTGLVSFYIKKK